MAIDAVNLKRRLAGVDDKKKDAPFVPVNYRMDSTAMAERRVALAGCRTADNLHFSTQL